MKLSFLGLIHNMIFPVTDDMTNKNLFDNIQGVPKKRYRSKLLLGDAHDFSSQFLNLFGFSISVSFVWCII